MHTQITGIDSMATKTITITEEAYSRLKALKSDGESFTDVINRLTCKRSLLDFAGILTNDGADELEAAIRKSRNRSRKRMARIANEMGQ